MDKNSTIIEPDTSAFQDDIDRQERFVDDMRQLKNLGPYQIIETIGSGSFGIVYKSFHKEWQKMLALKVFTRREEPIHNFMGRFLREADLLKRLNHRFLIHLYDAGEIQNDEIIFNYIAMEHFSGVSLSDHLRSYCSISWQKVLKILFQITEALDYMHHQGIIHRDIKPHNILYNDIKEVSKLIDLGLGKCITDIERTTFCITASNTILGTLNYMPNEQLKDSKNVNFTSDIYSLGATAYFLLSKKCPYNEYDTYYKLFQSMMDENALIPLSQICDPNENIPEELISIVMKMMSYHPKDRYSSAQDLLTDLNKFSQSEKIDYH